MKIITAAEIESLNISPLEAVDWIKESFLLKSESQLPPKISLHPQGSDFFNTMPCILPQRYHTYGCKIVSRIENNHPALKSKIVMFDTLTGDMTALMNANWITTMRTGAVTATAINTLESKDAKIYSFIGLGSVGESSLQCVLATMTNKELTVRLMKYKDHAEKIKDRYSYYKNVKFEIVDTIEGLVENADVIVSCITEAKYLLVPDATLFKPGVLVVPVHTKGFQNCDTIFDKVFADDRDHVKGFRYFNQFRQFGELGDVLSGKIKGRESDNERILSYNIGLGLHDIVFADKILKLLS